jgi:hypothetical protein
VCIPVLQREEEVRVQEARLPVNDSESEGSGNNQCDESVSSTSSTTEEEDNNDIPLGDTWDQGIEFQPMEPNPSQRFVEYCTSTARNRCQRIGLQCSPIDLNTPIRAWREIFKNTLLDKIVRYTNEYGLLHSSDGKTFPRRTLNPFLLCSSYQESKKKKEKPSNWFSNNRLSENALVKKIMSGQNFSNILRYLHCCPVANQDHTYKIAEVRDCLEARYIRLFVPGQHLSLDETLLRAFGRIKFKVRIVTKAARYGIKIYIITDATTAFVLRVVINTGKTTYYVDQDSQADRLKTVQIVNRLVEPFVGSHRTIYVDWYTSLGLLKSLAEKNLYITRTMLANRIPMGIRIAKTSTQFKQMSRGDAVKCKVRSERQVGRHLRQGWYVGVTGTWFIACRRTAITLSLMSAAAEAWEVSFGFQGQYQ